MWLELRAVVRVFGTRRAVDGLSLQLAQGTIGCLLGPSGCGKTTALRCIAGFESIDGGVIRAQGRTLAEPGREVPPAERQIGMVFQDYALFPHLTVLQNVAFGLHRLDAAARVRRAREMLEVVGLAEYRNHYPHQLSGGQQQRVALARALAPEPQLVLLDEPFSSLDIELRERLGAEVRSVLKQLNATALLVTHDQQEAFAVADMIGVMRAGKLEQWGSPFDLYHRPATRFVADFIGDGVFLAGEMLDERRVRTELGDLQIVSTEPLRAGAKLDVLIRPDDVIHDDSSALQAEVCSRTFRGSQFVYTLKLPSGTRVLALVPSHHNHEIGDRIGIRVDCQQVVGFAD
jgi:iron(III) transport system ATP-binding protein